MDRQATDRCQALSGQVKRRSKKENKDYSMFRDQQSEEDEKSGGRRL